jgi:hypothetical protein
MCRVSTAPIKNTFSERLVADVHVEAATGLLARRFAADRFGEDYRDGLVLQ